MNGWLIVNGFLNSEKFNDLTQLFCEAAKKQRIQLRVVLNTEQLVTLGMPNVMQPEERPDFVIFWDKDILLAKYLESLEIPVFNSSSCIEVCDDKRLTHLALQKKRLPMPKTVFAPMTYDNIGFTQTDFLSLVEKELSFPMIVKEAFGSFGQQVYFVRDPQELVSLVKSKKSTKLLFQEYIQNSKGHDIRLQVVGEHVVAAMHRFNPNDFRANISNGGNMEPYIPTEQETKLALCAANAVGASFAGVDLLWTKTGACVCEVNSNAHFRNLLDCTGVNTADEIIKYIQGVLKK